MFAGYVGADYRPGGTVLLAVNPGGGGDAYRTRSADDEVLFPLLQAFRDSDPDRAGPFFDVIASAFIDIVRRWNLWRILAPTLDATGAAIDSIAFLNAVPYRIRGDAMPRVTACAAAWEQITGPTLEFLEPGRIIALGKKAGGIMDRFYAGPADCFCIPRTIGDSYLSPAGNAVLDQIRAAGPGQRSSHSA